jgi:transposase-like protein
MTTDKLASYGDVALVPGPTSRQHPGRMLEINPVENAHLAIRRRERKQQKFKPQGSAQRFLGSRSAVHNTFNLQAQLISRPSLRILSVPVDEAWKAATIAA